MLGRVFWFGDLITHEPCADEFFKLAEYFNFPLPSSEERKSLTKKHHVSGIDVVTPAAADFYKDYQSYPVTVRDAVKISGWFDDKNEGNRFVALMNIRFLCGIVIPRSNISDDPTPYIAEEVMKIFESE